MINYKEVPATEPIMFKKMANLGIKNAKVQMIKVIIIRKNILLIFHKLPCYY